MHELACMETSYIPGLALYGPEPGTSVTFLISLGKMLFKISDWAILSCLSTTYYACILYTITYIVVKLTNRPDQTRPDPFDLYLSI